MPHPLGLPTPFPPSLARHINTVVVHCSATPSGRYLKGGILGAAHVIDGWHAARGFRRNLQAVQRFNPALPSIGYHFVIDIDGQCFTGRHLDEVGAHVAGHNAYSVGVCLVGGMEPTARYTPAQWDTLAHLVLQLQRLGSNVRVVGHRDLSPDANGDGKLQQHEWLKTCPGFDVSAWLMQMQPLPEHVVPEPRGAA